MKKKTIKIGFPMEYEDDDHVCHYGLFLRENEKKAVEKKLQELQRKDNNWKELKEFLEKNYKETQDIWYVKIINKMKELENNETTM